MPHFVIDCSETVLTLKTAEDLLRIVHDAADATGLFEKGDIKVRIRSFKDYIVGNKKSDFIHVFGNIMEGRSDEQKAGLSREIIKKLNSIFSVVPVMSINIREFEKSGYFNREML